MSLTLIFALVAGNNGSEYKMVVYATRMGEMGNVFRESEGKKSIRLSKH